MSDPSLSLQKAIRARLVSSVQLIALVPATNIIDKNSRPEIFPCIILGEGQTISGDDLDRRRYSLAYDVHIFAKETGLTQTKAICGAMREALRDKFDYVDAFRIADVRISSTRFMRDPSGEHSHAVMTIEAEVQEI